ncbi:hypothetical protein BDZ91DRAFT_111901 [Kalaharituber pfeilii]|nr:hypothetical protein BDZ91DRAFT_111901 [Kalaharituber pfeilii]
MYAFSKNPDFFWQGTTSVCVCNIYIVLFKLCIKNREKTKQYSKQNQNKAKTTKPLFPPLLPSFPRILRSCPVLHGLHTPKNIYIYI